MKKTIFLSLMFLFMITICGCYSTSENESENTTPIVTTPIENAPDVSHIIFLDETFVANGDSHSIYIQGELPEDVVVTYKGNKQSNIGEYEVTAFLHFEGAVIKTLTAKLTIILKDITTPEVTTPEVTTPETTTPEISTPEVTTPEVTTPNATTPEVTTPDITTPLVLFPQIDYIKVYAPNSYRNVYAWIVDARGKTIEITDSWQGNKMDKYDDNWNTYSFIGYTNLNIIFNTNGGEYKTADLVINGAGHYFYIDGEFLQVSEEDLEIPDPNKPNIPDEPPIENGERYYLGEYGDYVEGVDAEAKYNLLDTKVEGEINGIFQSTYRQGLLDLFDIQNNIKIEIIISEKELEKLNEDHYDNNRESYRKCDLKITYDGLTFYYKEVGIRQKGNTSRGAILSDDKIKTRHFKLKFNETFDDEFRNDPETWNDQAALLYREERDFFSLEKLDIRWNRNSDATYLKEYYAYEVYRSSNTLAPRSNLMNVVMNIDGNEQNLGVYLGIENIDKQFLKRNFVDAAETGDLYKLSWGSGKGAKFDEVDDYLFGVEYQFESGSGFGYQMYTYDLKTNKKSSNHEQLKGFINKLTSTSTSNYHAMLQEATLYDQFISYMAVSYLVGDPDDLRGNYNNTYVYFSPIDNKAIFIPTDHDRAFASTGGTGFTGNSGASVKPLASKTGFGGENDIPLYTKGILGNSSVQNDYLTKIQSVINENWMNINTFKKYYNYAYNNHSKHVSLGSRVSNSKVSFNLVESTNLSDSWNLSIELYLKTKVETFNNYMNK